MQIGANTQTKSGCSVYDSRAVTEDPNDRVKRGKTREWLEERAEKGMFQTVIQLSLQDTPAFKDMIQLPNPFKLASFPFWLSAAGSSSIATMRS